MKTMNQMVSKKEKGFTLIELVMVIVILGILAAFALPRFADFTGDAEEASVSGARGSVKSAAGIVRAKAIAENKSDISSASGTADDGVKLDGVEIELTQGYLAASSVKDAAQLDDYTIIDVTGTPLGKIITVGDNSTPADISGNPCFKYTEASASTIPAITSVGVMDANGTACSGT